MIRIEDAFRGDEVAVLEGSSNTTMSLAFSPDELVALTGGDQWVLDLAFTPDGGRLVSKPMDDRIRWWDGRPR